MKKKLHTTFWALGILVLLLSQLLVLAPTQRASAAQLTLQSITDQTYKFSVFAAMYSCLNKINTSSNYAGPKDFGGGTVIVGFAGSDGGNNDGEVSCDEAGKLWMGVAGHPDVADMMSKVGFTKGGQSCNATGTTVTSCTDAWKTSDKATTLRTFTNFAQSKSIPTSAPTWHRYILAVTALDAKCSDGSTITTATGAQASATSTVKVVKDDGTLVDKIYRTGADYYAAWPTLTGGDKSSCKYLVDEIKKPTTGANALAGALAQARINATITAAKTAICDQLDLKTQKEKNKCLTDMAGHIKICIDQYYSGGASPRSGTTSRTEPFDVDTVAACVESRAKKSGYNISAEAIGAALAAAQTGAIPNSTATTGDNDDPCAVLAQDVPMRWLACTVLTVGVGMAETFYAIIQSILYTPVAETFKSIDAPFRTFRLLGMSLIVITGLIMIIAQASGSSFVDAYTVKKVLPKLGIALVGIALALPLLRFTLDLTNNTGFLVGDFIANVKDPNNVAIPGSGGSSGAGSNPISAMLLALVGGGVGVVASAVYGVSIISFILGIALSLLVGVITLALRQLVIVVLILLAPLAIASYVLPGTEKLWKFWKNTLISTLLMFPIVMLFIKSGVLMASIFGSMTYEYSGLMSALVYFAPYFMIPFAFKLSGGILGGAYGMLNERTKGARGLLRNWRQKEAQQRIAEFAAGGRPGPRIFGKDKNGQYRDPVGGLITRAALMRHGGFSLSDAGQDAFRQHRMKLSEDEAKKRAQADGGFGLGDTKGTAIAQKANSREDFVKRYVKAYAKSDSDEDKAEAETEARQSMARLEGSMSGVKMGTRTMQAAAHRGSLTDNTAYSTEHKRTDHSRIFGDAANQVALGNANVMDVAQLIAENKSRGDWANMSSGQRKELVMESLARGPDEETGEYGLSDEGIKRAEQYALGGSGANSLLHGNPRVAEASSRVMQENMDRAIKGELVPMDNKTVAETQAAIAAHAVDVQKEMADAGTPINDAQAMKIAEEDYQAASFVKEYARLANVKDGINQAIPDVQDIYERLLANDVNLEELPDHLLELTGYTRKQVKGDPEKGVTGIKKISNAEMVERLRSKMLNRRYDWSSSSEAASRGMPPVAPPTTAAPANTGPTVS